MAELFIYFKGSLKEKADTQMVLRILKKTLYTLKAGVADMKEMIVLRGAEPKKILQTAIDKRAHAIMSYLSKGKWYVVKVLLVNLEADRLNIESARSQKKPDLMNIQINQPVGISLRYESGKFVFDTTVVGLELSADPAGRGGTDPQSRYIGSGNLTVALAVPDQVEAIQRRSYFRVNVPESLKVNVLLWHRRSRHHTRNQIQAVPEDTHNYCKGRLVDISAGGAQVVIPQPNGASQDSSGVPTPDFKKGQYVGIRFTPMPYATPLMLNVQIRNVLPTADGKSTSLGLQLVGLEASPEGRQVLTRLIGVVERYYQINQSSAKQQDTQPVPDRV